MPSGDSGLTALATPRSLRKALVVASTALEYFWSLSLAPLGAFITTGFEPLA